MMFDVIFCNLKRANWGQSRKRAKKGEKKSAFSHAVFVPFSVKTEQNS
jgi:hypothetical protein